MEAVAAFASIAGIITLAAQSIDGLQKLQSFFVEISTASKTISRLLSDINSLIGVLHNIDYVLNHVETRRKNQNFASLDIKLEDCTKDVKIWLETAQALRPGGEKGRRAWVRRARFAAKAEVVGRIREEVGRHRQALCLSLSVFGRTIDLHTSDQIYQMRGRFDEALTASLSNHGAHEDALRRIESYSITSLQSSAHSFKSIDSLRSDLSRLEAMISGAKFAETPRFQQSEEDLMVGSSGCQRRPMITQNPLHEVTRGRSTGLVAEYLGEDFIQDSRNGSSSASRYSSRTSSAMHADNHVKVNAVTHPADFHYLVKEQEDISKRFSEISDANEGALLYAQFAQFARASSPVAKTQESKAADIDNLHRKVVAGEGDYARNGKQPVGRLSRPGRNPDVFQDPLWLKEERPSHSVRASISQRLDDKSPGYHIGSVGTNVPAEIDGGSTHQLLERSLQIIYPPMVADYVSVQNHLSLCWRHLQLFDSRSRIPSILASHVEDNIASSVQAHIRQLRDRLEALQEAADISMRKCIGAGISQTELDKAVFFVSGHRVEQHMEAGHIQVETQERYWKVLNATDPDDPSDESDAYLSAME